MTIYISLLRGINVSGQKRVPMDELKSLYESLGYKQVQTYIQSGNVIFAYKETPVQTLCTTIEKAIQKHFCFEVSVITRTYDEFKKIQQANPFAKKEQTALYVTFLSDIPKTIPHEELQKAATAKEEFKIVQREVYLYYPKGYGTTKLSNMVFEKKLKVIATTRNWNTVNTLLSKAALLTD